MDRVAPEDPRGSKRAGARLRIVCALVLSGGLLLACGPKVAPENIQEGLPPWMTEGEEARMAIAWSLLEGGNSIGALDIARQMRAEGYGSAELDLLQGQALLFDGVTSEAERLLLSAEDRLPRDARPPAELCILCADDGRLSEAIAHCQRAAHLDEDNPKAWNNLSFLLLSDERVEEAIAAAERAITLDGTQARYRNNLGLAQAAFGRTDQAYRTLGSTMPRAEAAYLIGLTLERFEGESSALPWYERSLESDPTHLGAQQKLEPPTEGASDAPVEEP